MISKKMADAINHQINEELASAYIYLAAASYLASEGYVGAAQWMKAQTREEVEHAMKFFKYLESQGVQPIMKSIAAPPASFKGIKGVFETALKHEQHITGCINKLMDQAKKEGDHATEIMLQWFVSEQVEEEEHANEILTQLNMVGDSRGQLFMLDHRLGKRTAGGEE
ncbi:MAG: ferritin [Kiritimatiellae bacterium]|nr:ferritin [Kiritimatiellia bacterium]